MPSQPWSHYARHPVLLLVLAMLFWAGNTVAGRLAVDQISPLMLVSLRWVLVIAVLWPVYGKEVRQSWPEIRKSFPAILVMATCGFTVFNVLFYYAAHSTSAVNIGILQGSMPIFVLLGAFLMQGTRTTLVQAIGTAITATGVLLVATQGSPLAIVHMQVTRGDGLMLLACILYALYTVALRERPAMSGTAFFTLLAALAAVTSLPLIVVEAVTNGLHMPTGKGLLVSLYVAIFPSCISQLFFLRGVDELGPSRAGMFMNLVPIFSALLGVGLLGEAFRWYHALAMVFVIGGIAMAEQGGRLWKRAPRADGRDVQDKG